MSASSVRKGTLMTNITTTAATAGMAWEKTLWFSQAFPTFSQVFSKFLDVIGPVQICLDPFGHIRTHSDAFGVFGRLEITTGRQYAYVRSMSG